MGKSSLGALSRLLVLAIGCVPVAFAVESGETARSPRPLRKRANLDYPEPARKVWGRFVQHLKKIGREDLLPPAEEQMNSARQGKDPILPILLRLSNDMVKVDASLQKKFILAVTRTKGRKEKTVAPRRDRREHEGDLQDTARLLAKLRQEDDPYIRAYADFYTARLQLRSGEAAESVPILKGLLRSRFFLSRRAARRYLTKAYQETGEKTLAILEVQRFRANLEEEDLFDEFWSKATLKTLRKNHQGPLHDTARRAERASVFFSTGTVDETTGKAQVEIEERLEKMLKLLGETELSDCCRDSGGTELCGTHRDRVIVSEQRRVEEVLVGVIHILETACLRCLEGHHTKHCKQCKEKLRCKKCGSCKGCGAGSGGGGGGSGGSGGGGSSGSGSQAANNDGAGPQGAGPQGAGPQGAGPQGAGPQGAGADGAGPEGEGPDGTGSDGEGPEGAGGTAQGEKGTSGKPTNSKQSSNPADDTSLGAGEEVPLYLRRPPKTLAEAWGRINDREVARSVQELWETVPVSYRELVEQYYLDIADMEASAESDDKK